MDIDHANKATARKSHLIFTVITGVLVFSAFILCPISQTVQYILRFGEPDHCEQIISTSPQEIEGFAHIKLVDSVTNATLYSQDACKSIRYFFVRLQIAPSDLQPFLNDTRVDTSGIQSSEFETFILVPSSLGWHLNSIKYWLEDKHPNSLDYEQNIGIDTSDPDQYTVYVVVKSYD